MTTDSKKLLAALASVQGRAGIHSTGFAPFFFPGLTVNGVGELAFPLSKEQAAAITAMAESAPYGKGTRTEYDESVRKCWQIDAACFSFKSAAWKSHLAGILEQIRKDLGIDGTIKAQPYKLLLYGPGGHFSAHRDTEKLDAMFGTLIIALPSRHKGGQLHIRHGNEQTTVDFSHEDHCGDFQYAAFFADCEHEVVPVTEGHRFCVVYNLVLTKGDPSVLNRTPRDQAEPLGRLLEKIVRQQSPGSPAVILLEHHYTEANFSLARLKGNDRQRAAALFAAAGSAGLTARLALATLHQMGELEDGYEYGHRSRGRSRGYDNPDEGTMGEVYDESFNLDHWRDANDRMISLGAFPIQADEVITSEDFATIDPDEKAGEGYTGNAGCTMEYWYRRAAVVLWPAGCDEAIQCARNLPDACANLMKLSSGKKTGDGSPFDKLARAAISALASSESSAIHGYGRIDQDSRLPLSMILRALSAARRPDLIGRLLHELDPSRFAVCPQSVWQDLFSTVVPEVFASVFQAMMEGCDGCRQPLFLILAALNSRHPGHPWVGRIAAGLARLKPVEVTSWQVSQSRDPSPPGNIEESRILLHASASFANKADIAAAVRFLKSDGSLFAVRLRIGPLFIGKGAPSKSLIAKSEVAAGLLAFCKDVLAREITRKLPPYPDWCRPCPPPDAGKQSHYGLSRSTSPVIGELVAFMADPTARELSIRRSQADRTEAEEFIRRHFLDLDCKTIETGRPYTLHCVKNNRSYQHQLDWRSKDQAMLEKLNQI